jgi:hypothetical protein
MMGFLFSVVSPSGYYSLFKLSLMCNLHRGASFLLVRYHGRSKVWGGEGWAHEMHVLVGGRAHHAVFT